MESVSMCISVCALNKLSPARHRPFHDSKAFYAHLCNARSKIDTYTVSRAYLMTTTDSCNTEVTWPPVFSPQSSPRSFLPFFFRNQEIIVMSAIYPIRYHLRGMGSFRATFSQVAFPFGEEILSISEEVTLKDQLERQHMAEKCKIES